MTSTLPFSELKFQSWEDDGFWDAAFSQHDVSLYNQVYQQLLEQHLKKIEALKEKYIEEAATADRQQALKNMRPDWACHYHGCSDCTESYRKAFIKLPGTNPLYYNIDFGRDEQGKVFNFAVSLETNIETRNNL
jgi:hypothetical protein